MPLCGLLKSLVAGACVGFYFKFYLLYGEHTCLCMHMDMLSIYYCHTVEMWQ